MIRHFCDICEKEIERNYVTDRFKESSVLPGKHSGRRVEVEIIVTIGINRPDAGDAGEICRDCLYRFLDIHDHRDKPAI